MTPRDENRSVWLADAPQTSFPELQHNATADVAVIGGGIAGLTTALLLQKSGLKTVLLEAERIGCGTTGGSTAKVTSLHGMIYSQLENRFDRNAARIYGEANQSGVEQVAALAEEMAAVGIDCQFERQPAFTFTCDQNRLDEIRLEAQAARRAGLPASFTTDTELPYAVFGAVRVEQQAQFHPYRYCIGLARLFTERGGEVFENTRVHDMAADDKQGGCTVRTLPHRAELNVRHVVVATLLPFVDRGGFFARTSPSRSYGIAVDLDGTSPTGMYINVESPTRSVRPLPGGQGIIVVGEQHKVGHDPDTRRHYTALESWAGRWFPVRSITHRWSAQDYMSVDSVPYIGRLPLGKGRVWTATGFSKWGLSAGTAAAMILTNLVQGRENPWASFFDASRVDVLPSAKKFIGANLDVARRFVGDRVRSAAAPKLAELTSGEGRIVNHDGQRVAAYRDEAGDVHACSPICTHMGCYVQWNSAEKSWDCPCHGSRFDYDGQILEGPAVHPLEAKDVSGSTAGTRPASTAAGHHT